MIHSPHPFNRGLTATDSDRIERIQKILFKILLKERYAGYGNACELFNNKILKARKKTLSNLQKRNMSKNLPFSRKSHLEETQGKLKGSMFRNSIATQKDTTKVVYHIFLGYWTKLMIKIRKISNIEDSKLLSEQWEYQQAFHWWWWSMDLHEHWFVSCYSLSPIILL